LEILPLNERMENNLKSFLTSSLSNPYAEYGVSQDIFSNYVFSEFSDIISSGGFVLVAKEGKEILGLISLKRSDWDSKHFSIEISKIGHLISSGNYLESISIKKSLISNLLAKCSKELLLNLSVRVNKEDLSSCHALEDNQFRLMDVLVTYATDFRKNPHVFQNPKYTIRKFKPEEIDQLEQIAVKCFKDDALATDRFHADPTLPKVKSSEVYAKWLVNSGQDSSSTILVAEIDGHAVGFNICTINQPLADKIGLRIGNFALTAVDSSARNKLVATSLLHASLNWLSDKVDIVETGGQVSNFPIQRAWTDVGLKIVRSQCTFHWSVLTESL
jgi:hypothetical protein